MKDRARLILVGGFLGAGKTTLLYETTKLLMQEGKKVGLITNDQASELVDTTFLLQARVNVGEVSGSCFCCNFEGFIDSVKKVGKDSDADIIIAEPVGSCTDLSATIMQPLKEHLQKQLLVSPLTVLADHVKLDDICNGGNAGLHPSAAYIFKKQIEESDFLVISKSDLLSERQLSALKEKVRVQFPDTEVLAISSKMGIGITEWMNKVLTSEKKGDRIIDVDYDTYAEGEAVLGWLNGSISFKGKEIDFEELAKGFLTEFGKRIDAFKISVGHVKMIMESGTDYLSGNLTGPLETLSFRGTVGVSDEAKMIINARVELSPQKLDALVKHLLDLVVPEGVTTTINAWKCLSPGYPNPTYRYTRVIGRN